MQVIVKSGSLYDIVTVSDPVQVGQASSAPLGLAAWIVRKDSEYVGSFTASIAKRGWQVSRPNPLATVHNNLPWHLYVGTFDTAQEAVDALIAA